MKRLDIVLALALATAALVACGGSAARPTEIQIALSDFKVATSSTDLPAGTPVSLVITNNGPSKHELIIEQDGADDEAITIGNEKAEVENIEPGTTRTVKWIIPSSGAFQFACHITGHYEAGMKASFKTSS